jgi:hypothetical protein
MGIGAHRAQRKQNGPPLPGPLLQRMEEREMNWAALSQGVAHRLACPGLLAGHPVRIGPRRSV